MKKTFFLLIATLILHGVAFGQNLIPADTVALVGLDSFIYYNEGRWQYSEGRTGIIIGDQEFPLREGWTLYDPATGTRFECNTTVSHKVYRQRGHARTEPGMVTAMAGTSRIVDLDSVTYRIYHDPNVVTFECARCGCPTKVPVQLRPDTTVIWRKPE